MGDSLTLKDLAQRGLKCDQKIEMMLSDIWDEFEAIEPVLAKELAKLFGSSELASLMIIGRTKGGPSILEQFSNKPLSGEEISNPPVMPPNFIAHLKAGAAASLRGEMTDYDFDDQTSLFNRAERAQKQYEQELVRIFRKLREDDSELANAALELWEDENKAASFLANPVRALAGKSALEVLENGDRKQVLDLLFRLEYGTYP